MNQPEDPTDLAADEFSDLLGALGSEIEESVETALGADGERASAQEIAMARATIEGLRQSLAGLEPLGEELAETERQRMALESRVQELETLRRTVNGLLGELGRVLHATADSERPVSRRTLRRLANLLALDQSDCWPILADLESQVRGAR